MACSPFIATRCIQAIVDSVKETYPLAAKALAQNLYMDDLEISFNDKRTLKEAQKQVNQVLRERNFTMTKWSTNEDELAKLLRDPQNETKILGMKWDPKTDTIGIAWKPSETTNRITMRKFLSEVQQLYDPMGFLSPVTIRSRMMLQTMFVKKLKWDDPIPDNMQQEYEKYMADLRQLPSVTLKRWVEIYGNLDLFGFADASGKAYAAAVYFKSGNGFKLLISRSRVAPIKPCSIPRMELKAAELLAELLHFLKCTIEVNSLKAHSDSQAVLAWLTSGERQPVFIRNRVNKIHQLVPGISWEFIEGDDNPADIPSRGSTLKELMDNKKWWHGPQRLL
jgi:hypothetical protein